MRGSAEARDPIRWRGREVSRLEALTDGMFAIAITLLVVWVEVPPSFDAMKAKMGGFFAFALCFAMMVWVWTAHNVFFRRFGLDDAWTFTLNFALVFVVLFFVYPLKFVANSLVAYLHYQMGGPPAFALKPGQLPELFAMYGLGFIAVFAIFALLYRHAYKFREVLVLSTIEERAVRLESARYLGVAGVGAVSVAFALLTRNVFLAGCSYWMIGLVEWRYGREFGKLNREA
jgi:uncharacterized membrane protein